MQGDVKVKSKPVALIKFYNTKKSQISSTKLQINLKFQYSMTKACAKIKAHDNVKSRELGMMPWQTDLLFGFLELDHWDLFEI